jgi:lysozyme
MTTTPSPENTSARPDFTELLKELELEEGSRSLLYDDKTGKVLKSGDTIVGNPTIGIGWNVSGKSISLDRQRVILGWFVNDAWDELVQALPWVVDHPHDVQIALVDLCFNMGIDKLLTFKNTLSLIQQKKYKEAADALDKSLWAKQVGPTRSHNVENLIKETD